MRGRAILNLFHCDSSYGNRLHEDRFQSFLLSKDNNFRRVVPSELESLVAQAKDDPSNVSPAVLALANILETSLEKRAYEMYVDDVGVLTRLIFFDDPIPASDGVSVDFEKTKNTNYRKYCLFKFASFLDLLRPGHIHWQGQAESESIRLVQRGLDHFLKVEPQTKASILARWIKQPGPAAFSAKQEIRARTIAQRRSLLLKLERLTAPEVAQRLDEEGFNPSRSYSSYVEYYGRNPSSFYSWLSNERSEARKMSKTSSR